MSDVIILEIPDIKGNCQINGHKDKILIDSYSHGVNLPMQGDVANTERTAGRPTFTEMSLRKMSDLSTTELYKHCTQGKKASVAKLFVGRVEDGNFMNFFTYEMKNAMISTISTSGGGGIPSDSFSLNFTALQCEFTQQNADASQKGTSTWNWDLEAMKSA
ncbi:MAG: Hcp family type VI secretion system effector [Rubrivivax sp.]|jgi:type VI secretion system secreted protein Hcp